MSKDLDKALSDYEEVFGRPVPVRYDVLYFSDEHRRMDALLRRHYEAFHPLVKDIFTSFSLEFSALLEKVKSMEQEMETFRQEVEAKKEALDQDLDDRVSSLREDNQDLTSQLEEYKNTIAQQDDKISKLEQELKEKDALVVTQRRQLDLLIEKENLLENEQAKQFDTIHQSIEHVTEVTDELEIIEQEMKTIEEEKEKLASENSVLQQRVKEMEERYITEIEEVNSLYSQLKTEFNQIEDKLSSVVSEKAQLEDELHKTRAEAASHEKIDNLLSQNMELENEVAYLKSQLTKREAEVKTITKKNEQFKSLASKILALRDKLAQTHTTKQDQSKKIVSPTTEEVSTSKWKKSKTRLEQEIEQEIDWENKSFDNIQIVESEAELDDSISKIGKKIKDLDSDEHELIRSIKTKTKLDPDHEHSEKPEEEEVDFDERFKLKEIVPETSNLDKVLKRLGDDDVKRLNIFALDFPSPPSESQEEQDEADIDDPNQSMVES